VQPEAVLNESQMMRFRQDGFLLLHGFYDIDRDVIPVLQGIHRVIGQVMRRHGQEDRRLSFEPGRFDDGYLELISNNRSHGGEVYDGVKQIPAFIRLLSDRRHEDVFCDLRKGSIPGVAGGGYGIRIDNPGEDRYRAGWHQEYPSQLRSLDGLVFWSPVRAITPELGPVRFRPGSHRAGLLPVVADHSGGRIGAYALRLKDEEQVLGRYEEVAPLCEPGDVVVVDFLTLHASGFNLSELPRWSMQFRYFNFNDPVGMAHGWKGSFASGIDFRTIHPELGGD